MQIVATNRSRRAFAAPLTLVVSRTESDFEGLEAVNADNRLPGVGASWQLSASANDTILASGASTQPVVLRPSFSKAPEYSQGSPPFVEFHVFERGR